MALAEAEAHSCTTMSQPTSVPGSRGTARLQCCRTRRRSRYQTMWEDRCPELLAAEAAQCKPTHAAHPLWPWTRSFWSSAAAAHLSPPVDQEAVEALASVAADGARCKGRRRCPSLSFHTHPSYPLPSYHHRTCAVWCTWSSVVSSRNDAEILRPSRVDVHVSATYPCWYDDLLSCSCGERLPQLRSSGFQRFAALRSQPADQNPRAQIRRPRRCWTAGSPLKRPR